jgi:hypothetical protein
MEGVVGLCRLTPDLHLPFNLPCWAGGKSKCWVEGLVVVSSLGSYIKQPEEGCSVKLSVAWGELCLLGCGSG